MACSALGQSALLYSLAWCELCSSLAAALTDSWAQVLVYFAVAKRGDAPQDGGLTQAHGLHAGVFAERLTSHGIKCTVPDRRQFRQSMLEKLVWIRCAAHKLLGLQHQQNARPGTHAAVAMQRVHACGRSAQGERGRRRAEAPRGGGCAGG